MKLEKKYLIPSVIVSVICEILLYIFHPTSYSELLGFNFCITALGFVIDLLLSTAFFYYTFEHSQGLYINLKENKRIKRGYFAIGLIVSIIVEIIFIIYAYWLPGILYAIVAGAIAYIIAMLVHKTFLKILKK